ncbi:hypothetical protein MiSe_09150 [Microseira wollei NIES-4236]|uniref:Transposase n=1 Tax=Microseira wollei NIES-4236 TaxID=2530354 RepID=A0AAV3X0H7_9CYAN|nr:hypothetical protein MiSe_09150 [Microseira wollei NIES-4236]
MIENEKPGFLNNTFAYGTLRFRQKADTLKGIAIQTKPARQGLKF